MLLAGSGHSHNASEIVDDDVDAKQLMQQGQKQRVGVKPRVKERALELDRKHQALVPDLEEGLVLAPRLQQGVELALEFGRELIDEGRVEQPSDPQPSFGHVSLDKLHARFVTAARRLVEVVPAKRG